MFSVRPMSLGSNIRRHRQGLGLTLEQLSELTGNAVDVGTISALEKRESKRSQFAPHLAKAFRISLEDLLDDNFTIPAIQISPDDAQGTFTADAANRPMFSRSRAGDNGVAHHASQLRFDTVPSLSWEQVMNEDPKGTFSAAVPDDAMAPRVRAGTECFFKTDITPRPGAGVLVRDSGGAVYLREYREAAGGWEAHALNPAYRTLHSETNGLRVIAVLRGVMRGWEEV